MFIEQLGKVTVTPKGAWNSTLAYARLDIVTNNGCSYIAKQDVPAFTDISDGTYWQVLVKAASIAPAYENLHYPVQQGSLCWHDDALYEAQNDMSEADSVWTPAHWI